jgi:HNH endonuclease
MPSKRHIEVRFKEKLIKRRSGCHEWTGCLMPNGYGQIHQDGKTAYAHRVAWEISYGSTNGLFVLHKCDNRKCVNPEHLFLGTFDQNMTDMVEKSRQAHGEKNHHAKLNKKKILEIRSILGTNREIAEKYMVSASLISMIRSGRIWKLV